MPIAMVVDRSTMWNLNSQDSSTMEFTLLHEYQRKITTYPAKESHHGPRYVASIPDASKKARQEIKN